MTNRLTHEENILYLMVELDQALARKPPRWAPEQMDVARRWLASLLEAAATVALQPNKWVVPADPNSGHS